MYVDITMTLIRTRKFVHSVGLRPLDPRAGPILTIQNTAGCIKNKHLNTNALSSLRVNQHYT